MAQRRRHDGMATVRRSCARIVVSDKDFNLLAGALLAFLDDTDAANGGSDLQSQRAAPGRAHVTHTDQPASPSEGIELAYLYVLEYFRTVYIGAQESTRMHGQLRH